MLGGEKEKQRRHFCPSGDSLSKEIREIEKSLGKQKLNFKNKFVFT
jgi:hypothetical protein